MGRMSHNCVCVLLSLILLFDLPFQQDLWEGSKPGLEVHLANRAQDLEAPSNMRSLGHSRQADQLWHLVVPELSLKFRILRVKISGAAHCRSLVLVQGSVQFYSC